MQNYTQLYEYDGLGNILKMQSQGNWTRNYVYDTVTNRLLKHGTGANEYDYDAQGNTIIAQTMASFNPITGVANILTIGFRNETVWGEKANAIDFISTIISFESAPISIGIDFINSLYKKNKNKFNNNNIINNKQEEVNNENKKYERKY